ncbi:EAL domain-containing protein [Azonexus sp.]|uniref:bifunctional diguanylate cyclase/phosphodiesterase n=1 Tax=Azonexus sp. TaxID=1872668 RepID=UPI0035B2F0AA
MSLRSQLFAGISVVFLLVFIGMATLGIRSTRDYLQHQLGSHAQDAATSLVHPLSRSLGAGDRPLLETQVASLFDRGYFQRISVLAMNGSVVYERALPAKIDGVPLWFSSLLALDAPPGEAFLNSGWVRLGKVVAISQPTHAYRYLWRSALEISGWMLLAYFVALGITGMVLRWILRPLSAIEHSASEIQRKRFVQIAERPRAKELSRVVGAMNDMSRRIAEIVDEESARAEGYRCEAYQDQLTGLDNRRSFDLRFSQALADSLEFSDAALIGIDINNLKDFNTESSYRRGDELLAQVAAAAREILQGNNAIHGRIGGSSFAFVLFDPEVERVSAACRQLRERLATLFAAFDAGGRGSFSIGVVHFAPGEGRSSVFSRLDLAIESARQSGHNALHHQLGQGGDASSLGSAAWRTLIQDALAEKRWRLVAQPVVLLADGSKIQQEIMARLVDQLGSLVPASLFMPMAMRHQLMPEVDRALLSLVFEHLAVSAQEDGIGLAVNVSNHSLANRDFMKWLTVGMARLRRKQRALSFEISEFGCSIDPDAIADFAGLVRSHGFRFGIDHFGLAPNSLALLRALPPDYIKLHASLIAEAPQNEVAHALLRSLVTLARSLGVEVVAQGVENPAQVDMLLSDAILLGQGYHFGMPESFEIKSA